MDYKIFVAEWLRRSKEKHRVTDEGDQFISLWIAFNGWMKSEFGEDTNDVDLINKITKHETLNRSFASLKDLGPMKNRLNELAKYPVINMRRPDYKNEPRRYDGSFESLMRVIYQIRCNLFHGRKNIQENKKDFLLVRLAYGILLPLFDGYLSSSKYL